MNTKLTIRGHLIDRLQLLPTGQMATLPELVADEIGVTRRAVEHVLGLLHEEGQIIWHRKPKGGIRRAWYFVTVINLESPVVKVAP